MAEENNVPYADQQAKGAPEGVTNKDLSQGDTGVPPTAPVVSNEPPKVEITPEEKAAAETAEAAKVAEATRVADEAAKAAEEAAKADEDTDTKEFPVYNDPAADSVVALLKKAGVTPSESDKFFNKAVQSGNFDDIDVAGLEAKVGKDEAALILIGAKDYYNRQKEASGKVVEAIHAVVGGPEQFEALRAWALTKEQSDKEFAPTLNEYRAMLAGTPTQASLATKALLDAYNADPKTKSLSVNIVHGDSTASALTGLEPISRGDYIAALITAERKGDRAEVARLNARRKASMIQEKAR